MKQHTVKVITKIRHLKKPISVIHHTIQLLQKEYLLKIFT